MNVEQDIEMSTEAALVSALTPKKLGEIELQPYSLMRHTFAIELSMQSNLRFYHHLMTGWACTLSEDEIKKAWSDIAQARQEAFAWGEAQGYSILSHEPLTAICERFNRELEASTRARIRGSGEDGNAPKNVGGQPRR